MIKTISNISFMHWVNTIVVKQWYSFSDFVEADRHIGVFWAQINELPPEN